MKRELWFFTWIGGGYNTVVACSRSEALEEIEKQFGKSNLKPNLETLVSGPEAQRLEKEYNSYYSVD